MFEASHPDRERMRCSSRVVRPLARRAVVLPARGKPGFVKAFDGLGAVGLKRDVQPRCGRLVGAHVKLVGAEGIRAFPRQLSPTAASTAR
jgi:hypothetical protein